jgi:hypothetical protein
VAGGLLDDALELHRLDVAVPVLVEEQESLTNPFSLESAKHLGKLGVCHQVPLVLGSNVQSSPFSVPVERQALVRLCGFPFLKKVIKANVPRPVLVEVAEDDLVFGVWLGKQVLEDTPIVEGNLALLVTVGNFEQNTILVALDLVLVVNVSLAFNDWTAVR